MNKEIEIPEGYEARIEDNKVILETKQGGDERIRKEIADFIRWAIDRGSITNERREKSDAWLAYLEQQKEQKSAEWSKKDEDMLNSIIATCQLAAQDRDSGPARHLLEMQERFLKSIRPQPKEEREPMEIKYGGKIYQVHGVRPLPGGATGYIIEDEPGHYDCIINPEVFGGGYGFKQNGSPYPTKEATFDCPHWKPSGAQMAHLIKLRDCVAEVSGYWGEMLSGLIHDLQKLIDSKD